MAGNLWEMGDLMWEIGWLTFFGIFLQGENNYMHSQLNFRGQRNFGCACFWGGVAGYKVGKFQ